ncbi:hypothetical protein UFOVP1307_113 [uncultured Caudovirales phage]|uniref:Uncharacterized protein n=1 Tax=uncultured Caudovirales phage TaxID=2100421 RepID=A0A6J5PGZ0_9CAUD|nr:hypothetical protein UFOVP651_10 [uncultured Caudovirales phage]CAB4170703.1 hypothetical protein UFOVP902_89 [uncultured Caudovirales phage]CAB4198486.1 hypothetical protein UFOVP1307_113 [uncultured Caudovirales phage]
MSKWQDSNLRSQHPKCRGLPTFPHLVKNQQPDSFRTLQARIIQEADLAEGVGLEPTIPFSTTAFQEQLLIQPDAFHFIAARGGVEPPNSTVKVW